MEAKMEMEMEVKNKNKSIRELLSIPDEPSKKKRSGVLRLLRTALFLFKLRGSKDLWQLLVCGLKQLHSHDNNLRKLEQPLLLPPPPPVVAINNSSQNIDQIETTNCDDDRFEEFIINFYEQIRMQRSSSVGSTCHSPPIQEAPPVIL